MVRFRRRPFEDLQEPFAAEPLAPAALPTAALPFVQQLRLHLASDGAQQRRPAHAAIIHDGATVCWLDARNDRMMTTAPAPITLTLLQKLLGDADPALSLVPVTQDVFVQRATVSSNIPLRLTLWNIALATAGHGAPMSPLHEGTKLRLRRWPDFRILAHRPDHFRLCALLIKQGASVQACCAILDLPRRSVQSFFNAAFLTAYAFPVVGEDAPVRPSPTDGLVNLWRQLRIRWSADRA
ncbi:hypothetical protein D7Y55_03470 [Stenotrophomonas maltophilia]|uniref:HTH luxR-type domain-containing protein n=2 Tax=Stenotrophomonas TaxID=40323 RepID=A0ABY7XXR8_9GAMM|nr:MULTISPECIES: hypothetical protein [Stenotrophomonas]ALA83302.1 hypothetical protein VN11_15200 [Stenotrophomonas maltophilia]MBA0433654.1 hypothetical protein [Stenotrophomonas maltophilia]MBH1477018.1 hypothetical protein [Stenotrophomonas maltophilia]MBH1504107.1 hypothetical protein [Stenotrophomonas maltophilia]MBH1787215.1 hypothetical protein [Stenotrophomonas maltophilia]